jgi:hypothetical protein
MEGMPGMGMMAGATPEAMYMTGMGWMNFGECHHCSMPLPDGEKAWQSSAVSADGWTMQVRCALCARDMSSETKGRAVLRLSTEDPSRMVVVISDDEGNLKTDTPAAVFLEEEGSHARCNGWSRAFTSRKAFDDYVRQNPRYAKAKPLTFVQWAERAGDEPDTYMKRKAPAGVSHAASG